MNYLAHKQQQRFSAFFSSDIYDPYGQTHTGPDCCIPYNLKDCIMGILDFV